MFVAIFSGPSFFLRNTDALRKMIVNFNVLSGSNVRMMCVV